MQCNAINRCWFHISVNWINFIWQLFKTSLVDFFVWSASQSAETFSCFRYKKVKCERKRGGEHFVMSWCALSRYWGRELFDSYTILLMLQLHFVFSFLNFRCVSIKEENEDQEERRANFLLHDGSRHLWSCYLLLL